jgi:hypothetical protein
MTPVCRHCPESRSSNRNSVRRPLGGAPPLGRVALVAYVRVGRARTWGRQAESAPFRLDGLAGMAPSRSPARGDAPSDSSGPLVQPHVPSAAI